MPATAICSTQLVRRELRQKYKGSALGVLWYLVNPLVLMAVYGVMLGPLLKAVNIADYPIFILAGLLVWLFFAQGAERCGHVAGRAIGAGLQGSVSARDDPGGRRDRPARAVLHDAGGAGAGRAGGARQCERFVAAAAPG